MKKCVWCDNSFDKNFYESDGNTYYEKFCCNKCRSEYKREYGEPSYEKAYGHKIVWFVILGLIVYGCLR